MSAAPTNKRGRDDTPAASAGSGTTATTTGAGAGAGAGAPAADPATTRVSKKQRRRLAAESPSVKAGHRLTAVVVKCLAGGDAQKALAAHAAAVAAGVTPSPRVYSMLLALCAGAGLLAPAVELLAAIKAAADVTLDESAYTNLIKTAAAAGDVAKGLEFLADLKV